MNENENQRIVTKVVKDLHRGDVLIGNQGGHSVIESPLDPSGAFGFLRVDTEHGQLYLAKDAEVQVLTLTE